MGSEYIEQRGAPATGPRCGSGPVAGHEAIAEAALGPPCVERAPGDGLPSNAPFSFTRHSCRLGSAFRPVV